MSRLRRIASAVLVVVALLGAACGNARTPAVERTEGASDTAFPITLTDDEDVEVTLDTIPDRIITFAPSHTEIVFALGLEDRLVGIAGSFDNHPPEASSIEPVAGASGVEPNIEKVVSLEPDIVLTAFIGGEWKERLRGLDIPVFTTLAADFEDALADIDTLGRLLGAEEEARGVIEDIERDADAVGDRLAASDPVTCFLDLGDLFTVGPGSLEFDLLQRAGCDPVTAEGGDAYPQWSLEQLVADDPDVYLVAEGVPLEQVRGQVGIRELTSVRTGAIHEVNSDLISRPGPRIARGIEELASALHGRAAA